MKALVIKPFICKESQIGYNKDSIYEGERKRIAALRRLGFLDGLPEEEPASGEETDNSNEKPAGK